MQMVIILVSYKYALKLFIVFLTENETLTLQGYTSTPHPHLSTNAHHISKPKLKSAQKWNLAYQIFKRPSLQLLQPHHQIVILSHQKLSNFKNHKTNTPINFP